MHTGFNKTATIRAKTAGFAWGPRRRGDERAVVATAREWESAEGNLNEETRDNAWAKPKTVERRRRRWVKTTAESN